MILTSCPVEHELLPLLTDEPVASDVQEHVASCSSCRDRLERLGRECRALRVNLVDRSLPPWSDLVADAGWDIGSARTERDETLDHGTSAPIASTVLDGATSTGADPAGLPARIGKYLVVGEIDDGGQATVYRVVHPGTGQDLALKLAKKPLEARETAIDPSRAEAKILGRLNHPGLVRVVDLDVHEGRMFLVMDYVRGSSLEQFAKDRSVSSREAAKLLIQVAAAAEAVHRRGIFHQDIKPKNILMDESNQARLIDFGLARWQHAWSQCAEGPSGGTPEFMAPEQAQGQDDQIGPRTDVFALAAVLYWLLTGLPPFHGADRSATRDRASRGDFDRSALKNAGVPRQLERIVLKALSTEPADRHASAEALAKDLELYLRRPYWLAAAGAILLLGATVAVGSSLLRVPEPPSSVSLQVFRGQTVIGNLAGALPLRTGDRVTLRCPVPSGSSVAVFWLDSTGHVTELLPVRFEPGQKSASVVYPERGRVPLIGEPGTELVVLCGLRRGAIRPGEAAELIGAVSKLPPLPDRIGVRLSQSSTELEGERGLGGPESGSVDTVRDTLERLRQRLSEKYDIVTGIAFPHLAARANQAPGPR
jgi:serine/threonine protein kinase